MQSATYSQIALGALRLRGGSLAGAYRGALGGGSSYMVATLEIGFLIVFAVLGLWWFSRTSAFRLRMGTESEKGERALGRKRELDRQRKTAVRDDDAGPFYGGGQ